MKENIFHQSIGGRLRGDNRYVDQFRAPEIRELIVEIKKNTGMSSNEMAEKIGFSGSTLSRAAGGRAGVKLNKDGRSTTDTIIDRLTKLLPTEDE